jgi:tryptophan halogenase
MIKSVDRITIVGGGSAGWMTAAILVKAFPEKTITVIESPDIPIVGVGESTIAQINDYIQFLGIDEQDFMSFTDASYKLSIKFTDFYEKSAGGFHYPFGEPVLDDTVDGIHDWYYKKALYPDTPVQDFVHSYYPTGYLLDANKFSTNSQGFFHKFDPKWHAAYHFDATKFGTWLRDRYCIPRGVTHIVNEVVDIETDDTGIKQLTLDSGKYITSDLFVDCTGWKSLLLAGALNETFNSYADMLPNNRAWATRLPYQDKELELEPYTNCTALGHGWVWNIPLWSRIGTGYVYSDTYISAEDALEEFKQYLMSNKVPCPKTREQVDALEYRDIPMRVGIHNRTWVKNVVAIGLSAGFIEPLESNGLFTVHEFLFKLIKTLERPAVTQWDIDVYNASCLTIFRNFAEFVALHYALSIRTDTDYWIANGDRTYSPGLSSLQPQSFHGFYDLQHRKMFTGIAPINAGITRISIGMNYMILDSTSIQLQQNRDGVDYKEVYASTFKIFEKKKTYWKAATEMEPTLYKYLKTTIYKNETD